MATMLVVLYENGIINADEFSERNEKLQSENEVKDRTMRECTTQYDLPDGSSVWIDNDNNIRDDLKGGLK